jgi:hypothetical protein
MSFFPEAPASTLVDDEDDSIIPFSGWEGPPRRTRPGLADLSAVLGRSASTVVTIEAARCFPDGVVLELVVYLGETGREARRRVFAYLERAHGRGQLDLAWKPGGLRWGVEMADGQRVTTLNESPWAGERPVDAAPDQWFPDHPVLEPMGRPSGYVDTWSRDIWLWPLPPEGPVKLVCEWTERGITETVVRIDAGKLRAAASRAEPLWP